MIVVLQFDTHNPLRLQHTIPAPDASLSSFRVRVGVVFGVC